VGGRRRRKGKESGSRIHVILFHSSLPVHVIAVVAVLHNYATYSCDRVVIPCTFVSTTRCCTINSHCTYKVRQDYSASLVA